MTHIGKENTFSVIGLLGPLLRNYQFFCFFDERMIDLFYFSKLNKDVENSYLIYGGSKNYTRDGIKITNWRKILTWIQYSKKKMFFILT